MFIIFLKPTFPSSNIGGYGRLFGKMTPPMVSIHCVHLLGAAPGYQFLESSRRYSMFTQSVVNILLSSFSAELVYSPCCSALVPWRLYAGEFSGGVDDGWFMHSASFCWALGRSPAFAGNHLKLRSFCTWMSVSIGYSPRSGVGAQTCRHWPF